MSSTYISQDFLLHQKNIIDCRKVSPHEETHGKYVIERMKNKLLYILCKQALHKMRHYLIDRDNVNVQPPMQRVVNIEYK